MYKTLKYCQFVGDGDTASCYGQVTDRLAEAFSEKYIVVKEKYVGHEQKKRLGSGLRELKQNKGVRNSLMAKL